jgi:hypothetical protein
MSFIECNVVDRPDIAILRILIFHSVALEAEVEAVLLIGGAKVNVHDAAAAFDGADSIAFTVGKSTD